MSIDFEKVCISKLDFGMIKTYMEYEKNVKQNMKNPDWLGDFSIEYYDFLLHNGSVIFIWTLDKIIIASGMLIPSRQKDLDKFFSSNLNYKNVIDFGPEMVNPRFIGNGLQDRVIKYLLDFSKKSGYKYAISTIHPDNIFSINNFVKNNFEDLGVVELKRGNRKVFRRFID